MIDEVAKANAMQLRAQQQLGPGVSSLCRAHPVQDDIARGRRNPGSTARLDHAAGCGCGTIRPFAWEQGRQQLRPNVHPEQRRHSVADDVGPGGAGLVAEVEEVRQRLESRRLVGRERSRPDGWTYRPWPMDP